MFGDLMISQQAPGVDSVALPARFDARLPPVDRRMRGLRQKIFCVNNKLAVAWAGNVTVARHITMEVAKKTNEELFECDFNEFLTSLGLATHELQSVAFMFWAIRDVTKAPQAYYSVDVNTNEWIDPSDPQNKCVFAGSGEYHFFNLLEHQPHGMVGTVTNAEASFKGVSDIILRASTAIVDEITKDDLHDFSYGGGFEVIVPSPGGFIKIPTTQVVWRETADGIELMGPIYASYYSENGVLSIRRFVWNGSAV
jgi:hypothetical protein